MRTQGNDDLCTPPHILDVVRRIGPIALDPCSNPWSSVGATHELCGDDPLRDGLSASWFGCASGGLVYANPPYGRGHMRRWADKAIGEAAAGVEIVMLVKGDFSTAWWSRLRRSANAIAYLDDRIEFVGGEHGGGKFASAAIYFGTRPHRFADAFSGIADVRVIR